MWKKSLIASNNATALSPSNGSWDEQSDCSLDSKPTDKELLASPQGQVTQSDNMDSAEGIWSADIEQAFIEAMAIYPPCGRRKIILSEEGKMYGRNELIARYIKLRTGKTRTRKQVSSHIQVLGRRHAKFISAAAFKFQTFRDHPYLSLNSPIKSRFTEKEIKACSSPEKGIISEERLPIKDGVVYHTPTKNFTSNECRGNNIMTPLKSSSAFNSATPREDLAPSEIHSLDDNNNNNNNSKFTSENCSAQFYPDSTFSPSSHNNNGAMFPLQYNSPNFPPNEGTAYPYTQVQPYSGNSYCAPQDFRGHHRYRPETPTSCYPPMAHTYSPFTSQHQLWSSPGQYNRCMRTPDHATCNVSDHRRTPCMARDLTMGSSLKCIESPKLKLVEMSAFMESPTLNGQMRPNVHNFLHVDMSSYDNTEFETIDINKILDKFPSNKGGLMELFERGPKEGFYLIKFWTNLNVDLEATTDHFFASTTRFESRVFCSEIQSSSKVCSFGRQVVERIEKESCSCTENKFHFEFVRLPMCDYLVNFLHKLKQLPEKKMMNSVLENFTILQVVTSVETRETLLCLGFVFEVSENDADIQHCIYRLV